MGLKRIFVAIRKANNAIALKVTNVMATMACVYAFTIWALLPLAIPKLQPLVFYVSGGIIQLVALPMIMVGQSVMGKRAERRAQNDHDMLIEQLRKIREMAEDMRSLLRQAGIDPDSN